MRTRPLMTMSASIVALACGGGTVASPREPAPARAEVVLVASPPRLADGVTLLEPLCAGGAEERCDALDQDCDGGIDEGCEGAPAAPVVAALAWNGAADVDLVLHAPGSVSPERDAHGCGEARLERAWVAEPAGGTYRVEVVHAGACDGEEPVTVSASLSVNGAAIGPVNRALAPGERAAVIEIDLSPR